MVILQDRAIDHQTFLILVLLYVDLSVFCKIWSNYGASGVSSRLDVTKDFFKFKSSIAIES